MKYYIAGSRGPNMATQHLVKAGAKFGIWTLRTSIGSGGNGLVWGAEDESGRLGAIKFLLPRYWSDETRFARFRSEVYAMKVCNDIPGVLPFLDSFVPPHFDGSPPWLVSALGEPLPKRLSGLKTLAEQVRVCSALADTLAVMHGRGYSHRDIKPENIFWCGNRWCIGDFGLADFETKDSVTQVGERLGPAHYIAPEMLNDALNADGKPADVYSLAKLLWKLATGQRYPLPGIQSRHEKALSISGNVVHQRAHALDGLLEAATQFDPSRRPLMSAFAAELKDWLQPPTRQARQTDLSAFRERIQDLTNPYIEEQRRRTTAAEQVDSERARVFAVLEQTLKLIRTELVAAGFHTVDITGGSGGNADYFRAATGNPTAGCDDGIFIFQQNLIAPLRDDRGFAELRLGFNLGTQSTRHETGFVPDVQAPVYAAAGIFVRTGALAASGQWSESLTCIWATSDDFHFGHPRELIVTERLQAELSANLQVAVGTVVDAFASLGKGEPQSSHLPLASHSRDNV